MNCQGCQEEKPDVEAAPLSVHLVIRDANEKIVSAAIVATTTPCLCSECVNGTTAQVVWAKEDE